MTTNKQPISREASDDLRAQYDLDYAQARSNRFASRMNGTVVTVVLEPDVAAVFDTSESVNRVLRSVIAAGGTDDPRGSGTRRSQQPD